MPHFMVDFSQYFNVVKMALICWEHSNVVLLNLECELVFPSVSYYFVWYKKKC